MSKPAKPAAAPAAGDLPPPKSKKMLIIIIALVVLLAGGGAAAFFMMKKEHPPKADHAAAAEEADAEDEDEVDAKHKLPPKFVELGTFTGNLMNDGSESVIQVAVSIKLVKPELEEKVKERTPEIQHKINMLLQSKYRSELTSIEGKEKLASDIKTQVEFVLGLRKSAPAIRAKTTESETPAHDEEAVKPAKKGVAEVLFTSFIIQ